MISARKKKRADKVRVRFAPSPTGPFHIGSARTALFNYVYARNHGGAFTLRIEDTDEARNEKRFKDDIIESLQWMGISWDETPRRQSEHLDNYANYLQQLIDEDKAYYCFCSKEDLQAQREYHLSAGKPPIYAGTCRNIAKDDAAKRVDAGESAVVRLRVAGKTITFEDLIRDDVTFDLTLLGDFSIGKVSQNDMRPLYNFAVVVDDYEMDITHVIRGEDHISNTPKQLLVYQALGFAEPVFAHLPLILGADKSKMSKRHGSVSVAEYRKAGYLPEAFNNFLALLGWNPGSDRENFTLEQLIEAFSIDRVNKSGAVFNPQKLDFINATYIRELRAEDLTEHCVPYLVAAGLITTTDGGEKLQAAFPGEDLFQSYVVTATGEGVSMGALQKIVVMHQDRLKKLSELSDMVDFFFRKELVYESDMLLWKQLSAVEIKHILAKEVELLEAISDTDWTKEKLKDVLFQEAERYGDRGAVLWPPRVAVTGKKASAPVFDIAGVLGKAKTLERLKQAIKALE